jgi:cysteine desulfurase
LRKDSRPLYFDAHATTPCDAEVFEAMRPFFTERFGNAASRHHAYGWAARDAVEQARGDVAALIGAKFRDIVFTSGATESNNLALKGAAESLSARGRHIVTVATEHHAVLDVCGWLERHGAEVTRLPVLSSGLVDVARLEAALRPDTVLVSVMTANNEIGVLQPIAEIGRLTRARDIVFHTDASQAAGHAPFDVEAVQADLVSFTAHKLYGPKGAGALYVRRRGPASEIEPILHGGGHERGLRSGTLNVPAIVGFGAAARRAQALLPSEPARLGALRDRLLAGLRDRVGDLLVNGTLTSRLSHNLNVCFPDVDGGRLLSSLTDVAVSSGAACSSASAEPSHVLLAIGRTEAEAKASLRFGLCRGTSEADIDYLIDRVSTVVAGFRSGRAAHAARAVE